MTAGFYSSMKPSEEVLLEFDPAIAEGELKLGEKWIDTANTAEFNLLH